MKLPPMDDANVPSLVDRAKDPYQRQIGRAQSTECSRGRWLRKKGWCLSFGRPFGVLRYQDSLDSVVVQPVAILLHRSPRRLYLAPSVPRKDSPLTLTAGPWNRAQATRQRAGRCPEEGAPLTGLHRPPVTREDP